MQMENIVMSKSEIGFIETLCYWKCLWCQEYRVKKELQIKKKSSDSELRKENKNIKKIVVLKYLHCLSIIF